MALFVAGKFVDNPDVYRYSLQRTYAISKTKQAYPGDEIQAKILYDSRLHRVVLVFVKQRLNAEGLPKDTSRIMATKSCQESALFLIRHVRTEAKTSRQSKRFD